MLLSKAMCGDLHVIQEQGGARVRMSTGMTERMLGLEPRTFGLWVEHPSHYTLPCPLLYLFWIKNWILFSWVYFIESYYYVFRVSLGITNLWLWGLLVRNAEEDFLIGVLRLIKKEDMPATHPQHTRLFKPEGNKLLKLPFTVYIYSLHLHPVDPHW